MIHVIQIRKELSMMQLMKTYNFKKVLLKLSDINLFFWSLIWLMFVLVIGTIMQKEIGLYNAQKIYFDSWVFKFGPIYLPSARPILLIIILGLLSQIYFRTSFKNMKKIGISISHLGAFLLLLGSVYTSYFSYEANMTIIEGDSINYLQDYHEVEVSIQDDKKTIPELLFTENKLKSEKLLAHSLLPFKINIESFYTNSVFEKKLPTEELDNESGFFKKFKIISKNDEIEKTDNQAALIFLVSNNNSKIRYGILQNMPITQTINHNGVVYNIELRNKRTYLPFSIKLNDFQTIYHPATSMPKSFKSFIEVMENTSNLNAIVQMNEPLRYKGYTFYQSSHGMSGKSEVSTFAVVKNKGKYVPYISSIIIAFGLLIHLLIQSRFKSLSRFNK